MAVIEGYSEHVMDAIGAEVLPGYEQMREAMDRRRQSRSAPQRILERLLGLDLKMRQYTLGKKFSDEVVKAGGIETLNKVWESEELLPTLEEIERPAVLGSTRSDGSGASLKSLQISGQPSVVSGRVTNGRS